MKSIILSIQPKWVAKILSGEKTIEIRKSCPKEMPFKVYIYCTKDNVDIQHKKQLWRKDKTGFSYLLNGKVVAEFICDKVEQFAVGSLRCDDIEELACLSYSEMINYFYKPEELDGNTSKFGFALHISDLKVYDKPKELREFGVFCKYFIKCENITCFKDTCRQGFIPLTRPPQSWQYVEELK